MKELKDRSNDDPTNDQTSSFVSYPRPLEAPLIHKPKSALSNYSII